MTAVRDHSREADTTCLCRTAWTKPVDPCEVVCCGLDRLLGSIACKLEGFLRHIGY